jgi:hypothetical protein
MYFSTSRQVTWLLELLPKAHGFAFIEYLWNVSRVTIHCTRLRSWRQVPTINSTEFKHKNIFFSFFSHEYRLYHVRWSMISRIWAIGVYRISVVLVNQCQRDIATRSIPCSNTTHSWGTIPLPRTIVNCSLLHFLHVLGITSETIQNTNLSSIVCRDTR